MKLYRPSGRRRQVGGRYRKLQHQNATLRAVAAGTSLLGLPLRINSQAEAAKIYGTSPTYVSAAVTVLKAEDPKLVEQVLAGKISLLEAAGISAQDGRLGRGLPQGVSRRSCRFCSGCRTCRDLR